MSGQGVRFREAGYPMLKPLIPIHGKTIIERLLKSFPAHWPRHFVLAENHRATELPELLRKRSPGATLTFITEHKEGPARALRAALPKLDAEAPVLVSYCDYGMVWDAPGFERFVRETACDAAVVCYRGFHPHYLDRDLYAYCRMKDERVVEVREKGSFTEDYQSEFASSGAYYFKSASRLAAALDYQYERKLTVNNEYYTSLTVQALIERDPSADVRAFEIPFFFQWGTPKHLRQYAYWERAFAAKREHERQPLATEQLLMPMAGYGSRFASLTKLPKPLIPVDGAPMFRRAAHAFRGARRQVFVTRDELKTQLPAGELEHLGAGERWIFLEKTPPGQALTTQAGVGQLDRDLSVVVTACDHEIVMSPERFKRFLATDADAAIFTIKGFPHADRKPLAFAYVRSDTTKGHEFPPVIGVSVKHPLSETPSHDSLLVGTFWFRSAGLLDDSIEWLKSSDKQVNGEYYLDSVFELLLEKGYRVREVELDGYICWGDPDSYHESCYFSEALAKS